ncbi:MAG: hypothetical protein IKA85_06760 [Clostridia bacterium]|nr:hypothetical protein [Clostridia bacterium]
MKFSINVECFASTSILADKVSNPLNPLNVTVFRSFRFRFVFTFILPP